MQFSPPLKLATTVAGIPATLVVLEYEPAFEGSPVEPDYPASVDWYVADQRGYAAPWLERKLDARETLRLESQALGVVDEILADRRAEFAISRYESLQ